MADAKIVIIGGAADDQDHDIPDNTNPAWRVHQGANDYISISTADTEESITLGVPGIASTVIDKDGNVTMNAGLSVANTSTPGTDSVAIGENATAAGGDATSIGKSARAAFTNSVAVGSGAQSNAAGGISIGGSCKTHASNSIAISPNSANTVSGADYSIALGYYSQAMQPFEMTFENVPYVEDRKGCAQRKFVSGQCQTTNDDVTAMLNAKSGGAANGADALVVNTTNAYQTDSAPSDFYSNTALFRIRMISSVTSAGSSFAVGDFLCREYNLAIKWFYSTSASTIELLSDAAGTVIGSNSSQNTTLYSSRENVRATSAIAHETTGIIDSIELTTANSAQRGSWNLKVKSGDNSATIRHSCFIDQVDHLLI